MAGMAFVGVFVWGAFNLVVGLVLILGVLNSTSYSGDVDNLITGLTAVLLVVVAFGGGGVLVWLGRPAVRGLGLGLMIGWALTSILTAGFCTGLNPEMYL